MISRINGFTLSTSSSMVNFLNKLSTDPFHVRKRNRGQPRHVIASFTFRKAGRSEDRNAAHAHKLTICQSTNRVLTRCHKPYIRGRSSQRSFENVYVEALCGVRYRRIPEEREDSRRPWNLNNGTTFIKVSSYLHILDTSLTYSWIPW